jgi:hypothetical protein
MEATHSIGFQEDISSALITEIQDLLDMFTILTIMQVHG